MDMNRTELIKMKINQQEVGLIFTLSVIKRENKTKLFKVFISENLKTKDKCTRNLVIYLVGIQAIRIISDLYTN